MATFVKKPTWRLSEWNEFSKMRWGPPSPVGYRWCSWFSWASYSFVSYWILESVSAFVASHLLLAGGKVFSLSTLLTWFFCVTVCIFLYPCSESFVYLSLSLHCFLWGWNVGVHLFCWVLCSLTSFPNCWEATTNFTWDQRSPPQRLLLHLGSRQ